MVSPEERDRQPGPRAMTRSPGNAYSGHPFCLFLSFTLIPPLLFASPVKFRPSYVSLSPIPAPCVSLFFPPLLLSSFCLPYISLPLIAFSSFPASVYHPMSLPTCLCFHVPLCLPPLPALSILRSIPISSHASLPISPLSILLSRHSLSASPFPIPLSSVPTYTFLLACPSPLSFCLPFDLCSLLFSPVPFIPVSSSSFSFLVPFYC